MRYPKRIQPKEEKEKKGSGGEATARKNRRKLEISTEAM